MRMKGFRRMSPRDVATSLGLALISAAIFVFDTVTDYAIAAAVFYTAVVLVSARMFTHRTVIGVAAGCIALTVVSFGLTRSGAYNVGFINTLISILAIACTAYLGLKLVDAEAEAHETRERLLRLARLTTLGQLTGSITHEVSQPLVAIETSAGAGRRWLLQDPPNTARALSAFERISADSHRASEILDRVRRLSKGEKPKVGSFDFNMAIREMVDLASAELYRNDVHFELDLATELPPAWADRVQIQQVFGNLILNGVEAMSQIENGERYVLITSSLGENASLRFAIADTGPGLTNTARERLFDAFWTTKEGGFGLGLTISRTIIEANGGRIWTDAQGALGTGSSGVTFVLEVPAVRVGEHDSNT
ncbi:C4-dicarboxylate-specific signal transduction histidine kinase [Ochrobactrum sp. 19YEA23]|uniref:sensor histidine kinase n=1 Tax=Ochrobactrum sp. 19YEA23 TaxID=3039854 RepID=UPI002479B597|nr:C4-dicarboxylate-specific signal transduction histidine kinase [Ochrobactrum sp. 19YEA23]